MVSLETESDRTLFFDLLPIEVGTIGGFKTRLQLYTVPGQVFYNTTRKLVLKGVDGLVFVADSQRPMREANLESISSLKANLEELALDINELPLVLQYNKRDLKNILTVEELNEDLNSELTLPFFESSAINGDGVFETLKEITKLTLKKLRKRMASPQQEESPRPRLSSAPPPPAHRSTPSSPSKPTSISAAALARAAEEGVDESLAEAPAAAPMPTESPAPVPEPRPEPTPPPEAPAQLGRNEETAAPAAAPQPAPAPDAPAPEDLEITAQAAVPPMEELEAQEAPEELELIEVEEPAAAEPAGEVMEGPAAYSAAEHASAEAFDGEAVELIEVEDTPTPEAPLEEPAAEAQPAAAAAEVATPTPEAAVPDEESTPAESEVEVEFDQTGVDVAPPPLKRVKVSNQLDILAELDGLRKQATMSTARREVSPSGNLDLDSLLASPTGGKRKDIRHKVEEALNSNIFARMRRVQLAIRIEDDDGEVIQILDPVQLALDEDGASLNRLSLQLTVDLENQS